MTANCIVQQDDTTAGMKGATPDSVIMTPASTVSQTFSVGPNCVWLMAHGLTGTDTIRVMMVSGPGAGTHVTPFRPTGADPVEDVVLSVGRTSLPIYYPGRYRLERLVGATAATVYMIKTMVAHDAGTFYNEVTGDTVVNTIDVGTVSPSFDVDFDPTSGDVVFDLSLNIDPDSDNLVTEEAGGISVIAVDTVSPLDTATINMTVTQVDPNIAVVSGDVRISANAGNVITAVADGLFANPVTSVAVTDTTTIDLTLGGTAQVPSISGAVIISPDSDNIIAARGNGLAAARQSEQTMQSNTYSFGDTDVQLLSFVTAFRDPTATVLPVNHLVVLGDAISAQAYAEVSIELYAEAYTTESPSALLVKVTETNVFASDPVFQSRIAFDGHDEVSASAPFHLATLQFRAKLANNTTLYFHVSSADVGVTNLYGICSVRVIRP